LCAIHQVHLRPQLCANGNVPYSNHPEGTWQPTPSQTLTHNAVCTVPFLRNDPPLPTPNLACSQLSNSQKPSVPLLPPPHHLPLAGGAALTTASCSSTCTAVTVMVGCLHHSLGKWRRAMPRLRCRPVGYWAQPQLPARAQKAEPTPAHRRRSPRPPNPI
jgi:hypothetical protein